MPYSCTHVAPLGVKGLSSAQKDVVDSPDPCGAALQDHIHFTIGCQSFNLKQMDVATSAFKHLLSANSKQSLSQQTAFLREYLTVFRVSSYTAL